MKRQEGESFEDYKIRRHTVSEFVKQRLRSGKALYSHPNFIDIYDKKLKRVPYIKEKGSDLP